MTNHYPFVNTPLPYEFDALEPYIDAKTMKLHHNKHLQTYTDNLNLLLKDYPSLQKLSLPQLLMSIPQLPTEIQIPIQNNAGGVYNHRFYFHGIHTPDSSPIPSDILSKIEQDFGSFEIFRSLLKKAGLSVFGSGYAWLVLQEKKLKIITTPNQNTPNLTKQFPLLNLDVWEHAYYLKHYNLRPDYIDDWFSVINWQKISSRFQSSLR